MGESTLQYKLTGTKSEVAAYKFTTLTWRRLPHYSLALAAAPLLGVGGRACAWRRRPQPSLSAAATPVLGVTLLVRRQPRLCLALAAVPILGFDSHASPWHRGLHLSLALVGAPVLGAGGSVCAWRRRPRISLVLTTTANR